jgi:hypothetical protein
VSILLTFALVVAVAVTFLRFADRPSTRRGGQFLGCLIWLAAALIYFH